jgi:hypothetical protein
MGRFCLNYRLRQIINYQNKSFFFFTKDGLLWGTDTGDGNVTAFKPNLTWANAPKLNTGAAPTEYSFNVNFDSTLLSDNPAFIDFRANGGYAFLKSLTGLQDVDIAKVTRAANVVTVSAITDCGTSNLYALYPSLLAAVNQWAAFADNNGAPGNSLTITSVAGVANSSSFAITIDTTDPDYVAGAPIWISLAGPTETFPVLLKGYESVPVSITV